MPIPYTLSTSQPLSTRRQQAMIAERALLLRILLGMERNHQDLPSLLYTDAQLTAVFLGISPAVCVNAPPRVARQIQDLSLSLAYRMGADIRWLYHQKSGLLYNESQVRRLLAECQHQLAGASSYLLQRALATPDISLAFLFASSEEKLAQSRELLKRALETSEPLRVRLHSAPPVVVFSTIGLPDLLEQTLTAYLASFETYEQTDVPVCIVDDARQQAPMMEAVVTRLRKRFRNPLLHLREWRSEDRPGEKAQLRHYLLEALRKEAELLQELDITVERLFGPGVAGSANFIFWYLRDHEIVWLDQDSSPLVVRTIQPVQDQSEADDGYRRQVEDVEIIETWDDLSQSTLPSLHAEPVDVLFLTDWFLDSQPEEVSIRLAHEEWPTREDPSYERVRGPITGPLPPVRICTFHICGHGDYRGRLLQYQLLFRQSSSEEARKLLDGKLPFFRVLVTPPVDVITGRSKTAFGTAIGFSQQQPISPIPMLVTRIRLIDFSVGILLQGSGPLSIAWAPVGLNHYRAEVTNSGRGSLAPYVWNEDLLWPLLHEVQVAIENQASLPEGLARLSAAGEMLSEKAKTYRFPERLSARFFYSALQTRDWLEGLKHTEPWFAEYIADLEHLYSLPTHSMDSVEYAWKSFHSLLERTCQLELQHFGEQLQLWPLIARIPSPGMQILT